MKKVFLGVTTILLATSMVAMVSQVQAQESTFEQGGGGSITCYSTYDSGTTTFSDCNGCNHATGSNLKDSSTCGG